MSAPVVLELNDPGAFTGSYVETSVTAQEQRFDVGLGFEKEFEIESKIKPFASFGVNMNYIQLEKHNYNTKVFEFISNEHTRKNVMLVGTKSSKKTDTEKVETKISELKTAYQIEKHYLETLL